MVTKVINKYEKLFHISFQIRLACSPRKFQFFIGPMNLVDLFAILPFFLDLIIGGLQVNDKMITEFEQEISILHTFDATLIRYPLYLIMILHPYI